MIEDIYETEKNLHHLVFSLPVWISVFQAFITFFFFL